MTIYDAYAVQSSRGTVSFIQDYLFLCRNIVLFHTMGKGIYIIKKKEDRRKTGGRPPPAGHFLPRLAFN